MEIRAELTYDAIDYLSIEIRASSNINMRLGVGPVSGREREGF